MSRRRMLSNLRIILFCRRCLVLLRLICNQGVPRFRYEASFFWSYLQYPSFSLQLNLQRFVSQLEEGIPRSFSSAEHFYTHSFTPAQHVSHTQIHCTWQKSACAVGWTLHLGTERGLFCWKLTEVFPNIWFFPVHTYTLFCGCWAYVHTARWVKQLYSCPRRGALCAQNICAVLLSCIGIRNKDSCHVAWINSEGYLMRAAFFVIRMH